MDISVVGLLKMGKKGDGVTRDPVRSFRPGPTDAIVPSALIRQYGIVEGAVVAGKAQKTKRGLELKTVETICGLPPAQFQKRASYSDLVAIDPCERFNLSITGNPSMRVIDLISPIGKGTRQLIVSPPKAGKTMILEQIAHSIRACEPQARIIALLIDERPEEVTHFRRQVQAEVLASSNDQTPQEHVELAELTLAHIRCELECGRDIVILLDSITRMGRAFNLKGSGSGRTMSGGMEAGALEIPRRFFGLARNIENGGSITIVATALVNTGSRMDELIFQEFKGTGNSEVVLDRALSEARIFPAINIHQSGTRKEERLYPRDEYPRIVALRRALATLTPVEAMGTLLKLVAKYPTNESFLRST
ncbi:transcription termination factor Rho [bacterium]|nr:transcription termination factor Rho [bacterium]